MRIIKPGKLGVTGADRTAKKAAATAAPAREIWDDYAVVKKAKKKKEYEKGTGNRMVPKPSGLQLGKEEARPVPLPEDEADKPQARHDLEALEAKLNFSFKDKSLLSRALTHRSALGLKERADYERLEFLGDAVLDLTIADLLSVRYPDAREGELSKMRAALVNTQALADIARGLDVGPFIKLGRGEFSSGGHERPSILADVMEAIIGAIYRDSSYDEAFRTIERIFGDHLTEVTPHDPKTELQELLHAAGSEPPSYLLELVEGPEHAPTFVTVVIVDSEIAGRGRGPTKKAAQQAAAAEALARMVSTAPQIELVEGQSEIILGALLCPIEEQRNGAPEEEPQPPAA